MKSFALLYVRNVGAVIGLVLLMVVIGCGLTASWLSPGSPWDMAGAPVTPPFEEIQHLFGTDVLGRDILAAVVHGARVSIAIGATATMVALLIGVTVGAVAGYLGGLVDDLLMRATEFVQAIPSFVLTILIVAIFQPSVASIIAAVAIVSWPPVARVVRGEVLSVKERDFVLAAEAAGQGPINILVREILPNTLSSVVVLASFMIATAILIEAGLSFLGLGDPNAMSWGFMIGSGRSTLRVAWWTSVFPGLALVVTVLALNLIGEGLADALNPRLRETGFRP